MTHDFIPQNPSPDIDLRLNLGEEVSQLVEAIEQNGFERDESSYTFTEPAFVDHTWLPVDIATLVAANETAMKKIKVSYSSQQGLPRPGMAMVIYLTNGERITLSKPLGDPVRGDFGFIYTASDDELEPIKRNDVARVITSLLFPDMHRADTTMSHLLAAEEANQHLDPTDPLLSRYVLQLLPQRADAWKREESTELSIEDDRDTLRVVRTTGSDEQTAKVSFVQNGSETSPESYFEATATRESDNPEARVSFERAWSLDQKPKPGDAKHDVHVYDFMRSVVKLAKRAIHSPAIASYEVEAARILRDEAQKEKADEESLD